MSNKQVPKLYLIILCLGALAVWLSTNIGDRHNLVNGHYYIAKHIYLPGWNTMYEPEQHTALQDWVGTKANGLESRTVELETGPTMAQPEATAGLALLSTGAFQGYQLQATKNGHFELYKAAKTTKYWTAEHPYRITAWKPATDIR